MGKQGQAARSTKESAIDVLCSFSFHNNVINFEALANFHFATKNLHRQSNIATRSLKGCWLMSTWLNLWKKHTRQGMPSSSCLPII